MKTLKISLENMRGKLSRMEQKNIMAGSAVPDRSCANDICTSSSTCCPGAPTCKPIPNWGGTSACD